MATTEKTDAVETKAETVVEVQPQTEAQPAVEQATVKTGMTRENIITISIIGGVILFFLGLGLGTLIGSKLASRVDTNNTRMYNQGQLPGGMMRRGFDQDDTQNTQGTTNTNSQTQTN